MREVNVYHTEKAGFRGSHPGTVKQTEHYRNLKRPKLLGRIFSRQDSCIAFLKEVFDFLFGKRMGDVIPWWERGAALVFLNPSVPFH